MHANKKGLGALVLGAVLTTALFAATSAGAATVSNVQVAEGYDYTNVTVSATVTGGDSSTVLQFKIFDVSGTQVGSTVEGAAGATSAVLDLTAVLGSSKNKTYSYEVSVKGSDSKASTVYSNVGTFGELFSADASKEEGKRYNNGAWTTEPDIADSKFQIDGSTATFTVTDKTSVNDNHQIIDFQCSASITSYYLLDDITNDVTGAIGAMSLVTNETSDTAYWMVLKEGTKWEKAEVSDANLTLLGDYTLRAQIDYSHAVAKTAEAEAVPATILYSIKKGSGDWVDLTWAKATNETAVVSDVCFLGKTAVANFGADLSTKNVAVVGGTEKATIAAALADAGSSEITLYTNTKINPYELNLSAGTWNFASGTKTVTPVNATSFVAPATTGKTATFANNTLTVTSENLLAEIGDVYGTAGNVRYLTLAAAIAAAEDGDTISLIGGQSANAVFGNQGYILNLNGVTLTPADASSPIVKITGADATLVITNGTISGATTAAALLADNYGDITIGEGAIIASCTTATSTSNDGDIILDGGSFESAGTVGGDVTVAGGYILGSTSGLTANAGKFDDTAKGLCTAATAFKFIGLNETFTKDSFTVSYEIMTNITGSSAETVDSKVYTVDSTTKATVQLPDSFVETVTDSTDPAAKQTALNATAKYSGGTLTKWQCYVLGMEKAAASTTSENTNEGPRPEAVQSTDAGKVAFKLATPAAIKAIEAGCDVQYEVEEYDSPSGNKTGTSDKVNWDESVEMTNPSGVRYYKMKVYISTKQ